MVEKPNHPKSDDAVLGGQSPPPVDLPVLGGIGGLKHYLANGNADQQMAALSQALNYGKDGLELLIGALTDKSWQVQCYAYSLLQKNVEPELKQALQSYNPSLLVECLHSFPSSCHYSLSPDGQTLAYSSSDYKDYSIKLWDIGTAQLKNTLIGHLDFIHSLAFPPIGYANSRDGMTLASGSSDRTIKLWNVATGELKCTLAGHSQHIYSLAFSPDGKTLASRCGEQDPIKLWDVATGELKSNLSKNRYGFLGFSPDGKILVFQASKNTIELWDVATGELKRTLSDPPDEFRSFALSPDGRTLAGTSWGKRGFIYLWDLTTGELKSTLSGKSDYYFYSVAFSPDGKTLVAGDGNGSIWLWDAATGELKSKSEDRGSSSKCLAFSPDGQILAQGRENQTIRLWDARAWELRSTLNNAGLSADTPTVFTPDGKILVSRSSDTINLWGIGIPAHYKLEPVELFHRYLGLKEALQSDRDGLNVVIQALKDESWEVHKAAYSLLQKRQESSVKQALQEYRAELKSAVGMDYGRLQYLLVASRWAEAEAETKEILVKISGRRRSDDLKNLLDVKIGSAGESMNYYSVHCRIPTQDLRTIHTLWQIYDPASSTLSDQIPLLPFWSECKAAIENIFWHQEQKRSEEEFYELSRNAYGGFNN